MKNSLLETISEPRELSVYFQPIFRVHSRLNQVHSVEALIRGPRGNTMINERPQRAMMPPRFLFPAKHTHS